ncbi:hypothetical protein Fcan01_05506 [Folsomia candida]|uniref:U1 small nuclear ribonucleoprotein 70 kDa n=1 Tax=Folsomia candida TaxID=158441 RepID=A0A226ER44_FOLCA|nr:hypothetical protein Fcan01_05506 [Folsomia candida]
MTQFLPPNLLALFAARDPIPYLPPPCKLSHEKQRVGFTGIGQYTYLFEDPSETPAVKKGETREERRERNAQESATTVDAYKTLFVGRINFDTSESKLRREFESYGTVKKIVMVFNKKTGKPRGYAFVEYEHERDMQSAYKHADGKKIDGRRVVVDIERGRTVQGWLPRRLGGGLGKTRLGGPEVNVKISGRDVDIDRERLFRGSGDDDRGRDRDRDRGRDRSRDSSRPRRDRKDKDKDKDKERRRSREKDRGDRDKHKDKDRKRRRSKSRSRSRDKKDPEEKEKRRRSKSPREKKKKRSKSRDRDERKKDKRDREHKRDKRDKDKDPDFDLNRVKVKEEPLEGEDYPYGDGDSAFDGYMKPEKDADGFENNYPAYDDAYAAY